LIEGTIAVGALAFACQLGSASAGMGYGTILTPLLLLLGFSPLHAVPAVLLSQLAGGVVGGFLHHRAGNIRLDFRPDEEARRRLRGFGYMPRSPDSKVIFILAICGVAGVVFGAFSAVHVPGEALEIYIGALVLAVGMLILLRKEGERRFSWGKLVAVGLVSAFNKGMSGGGYVPLVAGGQIIAGREVKSAVGSTLLAVALVCGAGFAAYLLMEREISWSLSLAAALGSVAGSVPAAFIVRRAKPRRLKTAVGGLTAGLGALLLFRILAF